MPYFLAKVVVDNVLGMPIEREDPNTISRHGEMDESAMTEIGGILNGHYITSISDFISVSMVCTSPKIGFGTFQNVNLRSKIQYALVIPNELKMEGVDAILGDFFFLPDIPAINYMMKALGLDMMLAM